eukprot:TRINITY_DN121599_c0_g1_i1.p1 TRINITY_DN121599_c0_g1~~TRINITY_DN121599_c0_g1_i1.p1  ORF type:complete len:747 (+),score=191.05 TRINITY_DN121599_c0_g1_i1:73-2313(+)
MSFAMAGAGNGRTRSVSMSEGSRDLMGGAAERPASRNRSRPPAANTGEEAVNVRVVCRLRPMSQREKAAGTVPAVTSFTEKKEVTVARAIGGRQVKSAFHFDSVHGSFSTQENVFRDTVKPLVQQVLAGYEATAFAYGQTGTGKTYTMEGETDSDEHRGLIQRAAAAVLEALNHKKYTEHSVSVSYLEIYNEELTDLLAPPNLQQKLDLMDTHRGVQCVGLSEVTVSSMADICSVMRTAQERRRMAETRMNARSSRSHCLFTMKVRSRERMPNGELENLGKLHLVDLAGSECAKKAAGTVGDQVSASAVDQQERERRNINQSLLTLGRVIAALRDNSVRVPYRDSKLTRMLKDALGGSCQTVLIATVSPALSAVDETMSTLTYAEQASGIQNRPVAASMLRAGSGDIRRGDTSGSNGGGGCVSIEWAEMEMKVSYLMQEVEEAQAALARKYQEAQLLIEEKDAVEAKLEGAQAEVEEQRVTLGELRSEYGRMAGAARELMAGLSGAVSAGAAAAEKARDELSELQAQRSLEEKTVLMLRAQRETLQADLADVFRDLGTANAELATSREDIARLRSEHDRSRDEALQAIIKVASEELGRVGTMCRESTDRVGERLEKATALVSSVERRGEDIQGRQEAVSRELSDTMKMWSQEVTAKCSKVCETYSSALQVYETAAKDSSQRLTDMERTSSQLTRRPACPRGSPTKASMNLKENADCIGTPLGGKHNKEMRQQPEVNVPRMVLREMN